MDITPSDLEEHCRRKFRAPQRVGGAILVVLISPAVATLLNQADSPAPAAALDIGARRVYYFENKRHAKLGRRQTV